MTGTKRKAEITGHIEDPLNISTGEASKRQKAGDFKQDVTAEADCAGEGAKRQPEDSDTIIVFDSDKRDTPRIPSIGERKRKSATNHNDQKQEQVLGD